MSTDAKHPDLLALVAGPGIPEGAPEAAAHLEACDDCRSEAARLRSLRDTLRRAGSGRHLPEEMLVDHDEGAGGHDPSTRAAIEAHLERCSDCRDDLATLARARQVRGQGTWARPAATGTAPRRAAHPFLAAAAAILALAGAAAAISAWRGIARPAAPPHSASPSASPTFMPPKRSGMEDRRLAAGARVSIRVVLPLQASDGTYRARVERDDGTIAGGPAGAIASHDDSVLVDIDAPAAPGAYRLVLDRAGASPPETYVYPFRVEAAPPTRGRPD